MTTIACWSARTCWMTACWQPRNDSYPNHLRSACCGSIARSQHSITARCHPPLNATREPLNAEESFRIGLVVGSSPFHRGDPFVVQTLGTAATCHQDVSFVQVQADFARHVLLGAPNERHQGVQLGRI